jgi:hypothetical protein
MSAPLVAEEQPLVDVGLTEHQEETQTIIQGIQDAPASDTALQLPTASDEEEAESSEDDEGRDSSYWDAPAMAPLNAVSAVSSRIS